MHVGVLAPLKQLRYAQLNDLWSCAKARRYALFLEERRNVALTLDVFID